MVVVNPGRDFALSLVHSFPLATIWVDECGTMPNPFCLGLDYGQCERLVTAGKYEGNA